VPSFGRARLHCSTAARFLRQDMLKVPSPCRRVRSRPQPAHGRRTEHGLDPTAHAAGRLHLGRPYRSETRCAYLYEKYALESAAECRFNWPRYHGSKKNILQERKGLYSTVAIKRPDDFSGHCTGIGEPFEASWCRGKPRLRGCWTCSRRLTVHRLMMREPAREARAVKL
jgi:hypothetical protein